MAYRLGIDIGGTKVNFGLLDENKKITAKKMKLLPSKEGALLLRFLAEEAERFLSENGIEKSEVTGCGVGVPGTVSADGKTVRLAPNLGWTDFPLAKELQRLLKIPVKLAQDSRAAAWGEYMAGAGQGHSCVVCVTLGTGIGTGIVIDGKIYNGAHGCAGELGHIPYARDGRPCGCGKRGCLENYAAGKGIAMTANLKFQNLAKPLEATDVFRMAANGNQTALDILCEAVEILGAGLVSILNLLSPDILLLSGGMSRQEKLFADPLMEYVKAHSYTPPGGKQTKIALAALGEDAPMVGAALLSPLRKNILTCASLMCADMLRIGEDLKKLEEGKTDYLHFDIMDGHFVPNIMLPLELIQTLRGKTTLPFDIHLMVENPERFIPNLHAQPGDIVSVQWESTPHVQRALEMIKSTGAGAALAINPATPIEVCREVLPDLMMVLVMTVNPGFAGQKMVPQSLDKLRRMREYLDSLGYSHIRIQADGNCSYENIIKMIAAGADSFVLGSSSVFDPVRGIVKGSQYLRELIDRM